MNLYEHHKIDRYTSYKALDSKFHLNKGINSAKVDIRVSISIISRISGRVTYFNGSPASEVLVTLHYYLHSEKSFKTTTDANGCYSFYRNEYVPNNFYISVYKMGTIS